MLYSTPMVQGLLEDRKNQTRRTKGLEKVNENPDQWIYDGYMIKGDIKKGVDPNLYHVFKDKITNERIDLPEVYKKDDILWVREKLHQCGELGLEYFNQEVVSEDLIPNDYGPYGGKYSFRTIPSIHMPKWASRIFLKVKSIRVERLVDISEADAINEGVEFLIIDNIKEYKNYTRKSKEFSRYNDYSYPNSPQSSFLSLWESINGEESLGLNPWVWVIEFERIEKPLDFM